MVKVKEGEFISINYVGRIDETGEIFDLTDEEVAKKEGIWQKEVKYGHVTIVVGANHVVKGLEKVLTNMSIGETKEVVIEPSEAFGRRDGKLMRLIPLKIFLKREIRPFPGMTVNLQGTTGRIQSVESGRVLVDFNHPLAGKKLKYTITINSKVEKPEERIVGLLKLHTGLAEDAFKVKVEKKVADVEAEKPLPKFVENRVSEETKKYAGISEVRFTYRQRG